MSENNNHSTYSILLMRDDSSVSSFRLGGAWIKVAVIFFFLLILVCGAGGYGAYYYKNRYETVAAERRDLEITLGENRLQLQRLLNLERLYGSLGSEASHSMNEVVHPAPGSTPPSGSQTTGLTSTTRSVPSPEALSAMLSQGQQIAARPGSPPAAPSLSGAAPASQAIIPQNHPVKVNNLYTAFEDDGRMRVGFDLSNQDAKLTLIGRASLAIVTNSGSIVPVAGGSRGELRFQIARFRKLETMFPLPPNVEKEQVREIQVSIQANDMPLYQKNFPITPYD